MDPSTETTAPRASREEVAQRLREIAAWLRFQGGDRFRVQAYERAAATVEAATGFEALAAAGRLAELPGIGRTISAQIDELLRTGRSRYAESLRGALPASLAALPERAHLSPRKVLALHEALGITDAASLLAAAEAGRVRGVRGFGERTEARLIEALRRPPAQQTIALPVDHAHLVAEDVAAYLQEAAPVRRIELAGELRRAESTIATIALCAAGPRSILDAVARAPSVVAIEAREGDRVVARLVDGGRLVVRAATPDAFGTALVEETGPASHVAELTRRAGGALPRAAEEAQVYARAGLPLVPPERRAIEGAFDEALADPRPLLEADQIVGAVHCHTDYSDGRNTIEEMARAAEAMGYRYLTITDHSTSAHYAGGLDRERLERQWDEIDEVQARVKIRLLRGTESDITREGALDYPDAVLRRLDVVIASVHTRHKLDAAGMTERIVRAMRHPIFKIWGHPLGRILLHRDPFACDLPRILDVIAESRAAVELNGDPRRLDLPPELVPLARARGLRFVVSSDAHSVASLGYARRYGVGVARRGGLRAGDVLNTLPAEDFAAAVRP